MHFEFVKLASFSSIASVSITFASFTTSKVRYLIDHSYLTKVIGLARKMFSITDQYFVLVINYYDRSKDDLWR